ncbi:hypothetical protein pETSU_242 [Edwardsiella phage pEt-SU]|uniref:Uncharacterized protein n=1 Tax=Edwardsiella phage pEt-SU TaxID=2562142 RepID=A0A4D6DWV7_9CAUD|nr:hypothetical protein HOV39_gp280 [Edwardsiella phage pEt-SU]QBZ70823.1 hypothetical protein pETSU_242 [Edwardsiella phage pEt-SU]
MITSTSMTVSLLAGLMKWIATGEDGGARSTLGAELEFTHVTSYEIDGQPRKIILVFKRGAMLGRVIPVYEENSEKLTRWLIQRDTQLGFFMDETNGTYEYMADYAVNMFLVDPDVLKRVFEERNQNRINGLTVTKPKENTPSKHLIYEVEMKDFDEVMCADMGKDKAELGKVLGIYKVTDIEYLKDIHFECFVAGNEYENWVQCMVMQSSGKFPRIYGSFRMNDTYAVIESRFFKGAVETVFDFGLADVINRFMVIPHANHSAK